MVRTLVILGGAVLQAVAGAALAGEEETAALRLEYGTSLALTGDLDAAEAVFSSLLAPGPAAASAWCNLGNIPLIRGEPEVARDFYDQALALAENDAGVLLNRALARMLVGDVAGSREDAAQAMSETGGFDEALSLLGIQPRAVERPADEVESPFLTDEDVRALLAAALEEIPAAAPADAAEDTTAEEGSARSTWRPAGTRASGRPELARVLHWQH